ncbi:MAG: hypothetical protein IH964_05635 [Candidatus Dadabacteria bacterium]|nr:hypothetical protein [Candidatus Dadabacteria bacterium]
MKGKDPNHVKSEDYHDSLDKSYERQQLVRAAIEKQSEIIDQERIIVSKEIVKKVGPKYRDIVKRLALQYIALAEIIVEEINLREALNDEGIAYQTAGLRPMPLKFGDDPREDSSRFAIWIKECVEYGFIKESEVPKMFRDSWRKRGGFEFKNTALAAIVAS